jgi:hypothetical protein
MKESAKSVHPGERLFVRHTFRSKSFLHWSAVIGLCSGALGRGISSRVAQKEEY